MINTNNLIYARTTLNYLSGMEPTAIPVEIMNGRLAEVSFDEHGFELVNHQSVALDPRPDQAGGTTQRFERSRRRAPVATSYCSSRQFGGIPPLPLSMRTTTPFSSYILTTLRGANVIRNRDHPYHQLMTRFMEAEKVSSTDVESASRILTLQLWRNLGSDLMDYPLAFCDGRSVARDELAPPGGNLWGCSYAFRIFFW